MKRLIDLRSDTVTRPTPAMRQAIAQAEVGDDCYGEDPSANLLQERAAALLGKERALFVASGTMANQLAIKGHTRPGEEVILEATSHPFNFEAGAPAALSGVQCLPIPGERGILNPKAVEGAIRPDAPHHPRTALVIVENTHNRGGGSIYPLDTLRAIWEVAKRRGLKVHLDGARIFNASVASGVPVHEYARCADTVSFCLSKGLGAPVGSLLAGLSDFIARALRDRRLLGGGMRQVGILAAAGLYALDHHVARLAEDHENARRLAAGLQEIPGVTFPFGRPETNIVIFDVTGTQTPAAEVAARLKEEGVLVHAISTWQIRAVTHLDVSSADIERALEALWTVLNGRGKR